MKPASYRHRTQRELRLPYRGKVRLLVPFAPWRLLVTLSGLNLSGSGVLTLLSSEGADAQAAQALLATGDPYELQLEHDSEHLTAPFLKARLVRTQRTTVGWELAFAFEDADGGLLSLVHELSLGAGASAHDGRPRPGEPS